MEKEEKSPDLAEIERCKDEILKRIADKVKANTTTSKEFGAYHSSHSSSSKHSSSTS